MGKSFVLNVFRELGAVVIDADDVVRVLLQERKVIHKIKAIFGECVESTDGSLDKVIIANIVFNNRKLREKLEVLLHPMVIGKIEKAIRKFRRKKQLLVVEVPLLFEGEYQDMFDRTITVFTTQKTAIERLMKGGVSRSNAMQRLKAQLPIKRKKEKADYRIDNNGSKQKTRKQVIAIFNRVIGEMG